MTDERRSTGPEDLPEPAEEPREEPSHEGPRRDEPIEVPPGLPDAVLAILDRAGLEIVAIYPGLDALGPARQSLGVPAHLVGDRPEGSPVPDLDGPDTCGRCGTPRPGCRYCAPLVAWCN